MTQAVAEVQPEVADFGIRRERKCEVAVELAIRLVAIRKIVGGSREMAAQKNVDLDVSSVSGTVPSSPSVIVSRGIAACWVAANAGVIARMVRSIAVARI
jgi:nicotinic acid phosphoribosyltransferase